MDATSPILGPGQFHRWPAPRDYFEGLQASWICHVDNVLAFVRRDAAELSLNPRLPDAHGRWVWILALGGSAVVVADGRAHPLSAGHGFLLPAHTPHYYVAGAERRLAWVFLTFETQAASLLRPLALRPIRWKANAAQAFRDALAAIRKGAAAEACLHVALASERMRPARAAARPPGDWLEEAVRRWVAEYRDGPFGITPLAASLAWSESHLRRVFRERSGRSLGRQIQHLRLVKACHLMSDRSKRLTDIALACGYANPGNFSRAFRSEMGLSPLEYRRCKR